MNPCGTICVFTARNDPDPDLNEAITHMEIRDEEAAGVIYYVIN